MSKQVHARFYVSQSSRLSWWSDPKEQSLIDKFHLSGIKGEPFGRATPSASMEMVIANPEAAEVFKEALENNLEFDVVFTLREKSNE